MSDEGLVRVRSVFVPLLIEAGFEVPLKWSPAWGGILVPKWVEVFLNMHDHLKIQAREPGATKLRVKLIRRGLADTDFAAEVSALIMLDLDRESLWEIIFQSPKS